MAISSRPVPGDLIATVVLSAATLAFTLLPPLSDLPVRVPLGLLMVLFLPGYALIAALFPGRSDIDGIERVALSFGLSIAVVPLMGLCLNYTPWGIRLTPVAISLAAFTSAMAFGAYMRRANLSEDDVFRVPFRETFREGISSMKTEMKPGRGRLDRALTILLAASIVASVAALAYVVVTPKQGERFTEFYILGPGGMAYDYPTSVASGRESTVIVGIVNHEYDAVNYTLALDVDNSTILKEDLRLDHNETWENPVNYTLQEPGNFKKLQFLLYRDGNWTAPYRDLHLWVNVSENEPFNGRE